MRWFVSLLLLLTGAVSAAAPQTQTFTDDLGRTVTVPLHPQRDRFDARSRHYHSAD